MLAGGRRRGACRGVRERLRATCTAVRLGSCEVHLEHTLAEPARPAAASRAAYRRGSARGEIAFSVMVLRGAASAGHVRRPLCGPRRYWEPASGRRSGDRAGAPGAVAGETVAKRKYVAAAG